MIEYLIKKKESSIYYMEEDKTVVSELKDEIYDKLNSLKKITTGKFKPYIQYDVYFRIKLT